MTKGKYVKKNSHTWLKSFFYEVGFWLNVAKIENTNTFSSHAVPRVLKSLFPIISVCLLVVHVLGSFCPSVFETFMFPEIRFFPLPL